MKSFFDLKHNIAKIKIENLDDLWALKQIIIPGILLTARTMRSVEILREGRRIKVDRKAVTLTIIVEKIELTDKIRVMGRIAEAPEDIERGYHSIDIKPGSLIKIQKEWRTWEINRIRAMAEKIEPILICILDDREADFYVLRETAHHLFHLSSPGLGKEAGVSKKPEYYGSILSELKKREEKSIILAGPGFTREEIAKLIKDKEKEVAEKVIMDSVSHTGEVGLQELLRRGSIDKIVKNSRISRETQAVESVLIEIARDGKAVYGLGKVREIIGMGAADLILVSDKKLGEFEEILKNAEKTKSKIMVISSEHQSGEKLYGLGGIAALLRFQV